jgi:hypothetical protein
MIYQKLQQGGFFAVTCYESVSYTNGTTGCHRIKAKYPIVGKWIGRGLSQISADFRQDNQQLYLASILNLSGYRTYNPIMRFAHMASQMSHFIVMLCGSTH